MKINASTIKIIEEAVKYIAQYIIPIAAFILSIVSLQKSRRVSSLEKKLQEYDAIIKEHEVETIQAEKNKQPEVCLDARITKISQNNYKLYVYNKGSAIAHEVDYDIDENSSIVPIKRVAPFEVLEPGDHFEESVVVSLASKPKFEITLSWKDEGGQTQSKKVVRSIEY